MVIYNRSMSSPLSKKKNEKSEFGDMDKDFVMHKDLFYVGLIL